MSQSARPLNTPPMAAMPQMPQMPPSMPQQMPFALQAESGTVEEVDRAIAQATAEPLPEMRPHDGVEVELPGGFVGLDGRLVTDARVRELNGYDEEKLSHFDLAKNVAVYVTEVLALGVEDLGGQKPTKPMLRDLLIGDRDSLIVAISRATYGPEIKSVLRCGSDSGCGAESDVIVNLDDDIEIKRLDDPLQRTFDVPLRHGLVASVELLDGHAQEAFAASLAKKTPAEITSIMLAKSLFALDGQRLLDREKAVRQLSAADRATLTDFITEHQPGPQLNEPVMVACSRCGREYPFVINLAILFRL